MELGETMADCAVREAAEETGLRLRNAPGEQGLGQPHPFTAADVIVRDPAGRIQFQYAIVEVAATPEDPQQAPQASADADDARWFAGSQSI
ncbi:hypothetical protein WJX81_007985 [Elliptochloris bilobata]|uniref:Nudix hydrolase domain-containing protein n=1 Tax=Elliptochloris bilobata TaxID=381761 RepID=A0AAW1QZ02_9CHLO